MARRRLDVRAAIVHDWLQGLYGSERVVDAMRTGIFEPPGPDIFTFHAARHMLPPEFAASVRGESRVGRLPGIREGMKPGRWRYLLPYMSLYFARLDLSGYDLVVSSSHACAFHVRPPEDAVHLCYCYTPMRYAWLPDVDDRRLSIAPRLALRTLAPWFRSRDRRAASRPDSFVAISTSVADRIRRFYGREAVVVHPPVEVDEFRPDAPRDRDHFLWVNRLVPYKRPQVVLEAFRGLPYRLTMVGVGPLEAELRDRLPANVELRGWVPREELADLYAGVGGFVHVGEEDFGISMVEALAAGAPVVALARGGATDIIRHEVDGLLLEEPSVGAVTAAIEELRRREWAPAELRRRAEQFSRERFERELVDHAAGLLEARRRH